jgi:hypothetical protein
VTGLSVFELDPVTRSRLPQRVSVVTTACRRKLPILWEVNLALSRRTLFALGQVAKQSKNKHDPFSHRRPRL